MKRKRRIFRILPKYAYIPVGICIILNTLVYNISRLFTDLLPHYDFSLSIDSLIPYVSPFIVIYILSYFLWILGFIIFARENRAICNEMFAAELVGKLLCFACFVIIPTEMVRADISQGGFFNWLTNVVYTYDEPNNLFPSIHCMESWICFRGAYKCKKISSHYSSAWFILAVLICASTVFVKQHLFVDIFAGIAAAEIGMFAAKKFNIGRMYDFLRLKWIMFRRKNKKA
jgi:membrane-associated phospholipid phosphatase